MVSGAGATENRADTVGGQIELECGQTRDRRCPHAMLGRELCRSARSSGVSLGKSWRYQQFIDRAMLQCIDGRRLANHPGSTTVRSAKEAPDGSRLPKRSRVPRVADRSAAKADELAAGSGWIGKSR